VKAQDDPQLVIEVRQRVLDNMADPKGRAMVLVSIGDDYRKRLGDIERAIEHYEASVSEYPNAPAMTRLAKFALDAEDWKRAVIAFKSMAKSLKDPLERADAWAQAGSLYEHRLGAPAKAVHAYEKALNLNPNKLEPFESLVQLLAETKKWDELQASYERMIGRLEKTEAPGAVVMAALWTNLGEVKRHHLSDEEGATAAYEEACKATPHDRNLRSTLATLYASHAEDEECLRRAVEHNQALLLHNGEIDVVALQRIGMLYLDAQRYDPAWCVFRALAYLGAADARSEVFVEKYQSQVSREPEGAIDDAFFEQHLYTDGYDAPVGEIFAIAKHALLKLFAHDLDNYEIHKKKDRVDTRDGLMFNTLYQNIAQKLGFEEAPPVYEYQKVPSMVNGSLYPQGFLVGPGMLAGRSENEMSFTVAKQLAMFRDNAFLFGFRRLLDMQAIFVTLAKVTNPGINIQMTDDMRRLSRAFDKVKPPERKDRLHAIMVEVLQRTSSKVNLAEVARCLDNAANRCGFLFCDDLKACHEMLTLESHPDNNTAERPSLEVRMQDLVLWSVTPEYHALREQLGIAIDQSQ
jgi:tetratricopeptide (TPR) repeat protein